MKENKKKLFRCCPSVSDHQHWMTRANLSRVTRSIHVLYLTRENNCNGQKVMDEFITVNWEPIICDILPIFDLGFIIYGYNFFVLALYFFK